MWWTKLFNSFDRFSKAILEVDLEHFLPASNRIHAFGKINNVKRHFRQTNGIVSPNIINTCNSSNVAWWLSGRRRNIKLCSEVPMMSLSLVYCLVIAEINTLLKSFKTSGSTRSILSTSFDSEITSSRINLESNERYKRKVEWHNTWINGSSTCRKVLQLSNIGITDRTNIAYN